MRYRYSGKVVMFFCLVVIAIWVVISALKWPMKTAIFPIIIGSVVFLLAVTELCFTLFEKKGTEKTETMDFQLSKDIDQALANRRTLSIFAWIIGFFFLILLLGVPIALPLFMFLYLKLSGKEGWRISIGLTAVVWVCFYFLFIWFLRTQFLSGWIQQWLSGVIF